MRDFGIVRTTSLVVLLLMMAGSAAAGTLYKSVGPDGRVTYSDQPPANARVQKTLTFADQPASPVPEALLRLRAEILKSADARLAATSSEEVELFSADWCGFCRKAKAYLAAHDIAYREYDIDTAEGQQAFARTGVGKGIPLLRWKGRQLQGFSTASYDSLFAGP